jgi:hypothetical protein
MSKPTSPTYKTTNWADYNAALKRRGSLTIWFDPEMNWDGKPSGKRGRSQTFRGEPDQETVRGTVYPANAIQTCLTMKVLFRMALRQTTGFVESLLRLTGLDWAVPDFSTICRRQRTLAVSIPYRCAKGPLHLLIDSTGIKVEGEGEWNARKHSSRDIATQSPAGQWAAPNDASGARFKSVLMSKRWKSGQSRSRAATPGMHRCCLICSTRSRTIMRLAA